MKINSTVVLLIFVISAIVTIFLVQRKIDKRDGKAHMVIGILQTASHPALDQAREGFIKTMKERLDNQVEFVVRNAEGSLANAQTIAQSFHINPEIKAIYAIATPAAQMATAIEKEKPIIIAAVTDPSALGLVHPKTNVTGSSDAINVAAQVTLIKQLLPQAKTVAVLYTASEINSTIIAKKIIENLLAQGLSPLEISFNSEADLVPALENALRNADAVITPADNTIALAIQLVADRALRAKKPLIVSDNLLVKFMGVLAARGVDYERGGIQAAHAALAVLKDDKKPADVPIVQPTADLIFINKQTLHELGLTIPGELEPMVHSIL